MEFKLKEPVFVSCSDRIEVSKDKIVIVGENGVEKHIPVVGADCQKKPETLTYEQAKEKAKEYWVVRTDVLEADPKTMQNGKLVYFNASSKLQKSEMNYAEYSTYKYKLYAKQTFEEVEIPIEDVVKTVMSGETVYEYCGEKLEDTYTKDGFDDGSLVAVDKYSVYKVRRLLPPDPETLKEV
jgi:hypothetical protein